jgi:hypothetical protein
MVTVRMKMAEHGLIVTKMGAVSIGKDMYQETWGRETFFQFSFPKSAPSLTLEAELDLFSLAFERKEFPPWWLWSLSL